MDEVALLKDLYSGKSLKPLSGHKKKAYKYSLCGIFINIISGNHTTGSQMQNIEFAKQIRDSKLSKKEYETREKMAWDNVQKSFESSPYKKPYNDELINDIIAFTRERLVEIEENGVSLFQAKQIKNIIHYNKYTGIQSLRDYHWFEFDINRGIIPTIPQMIIFNDLKVHWNQYIESLENYSEIGEEVVTNRQRFDVITSPRHRAFQHKASAMQRNLVFLGVTFVEACLYDYFYNIKFSSFQEKEKISSILGKSKINDKAIVEDIIFKLYPDSKVEIEPLYNQYKEILHYRDRYVHASPFIDEANNTSQLQPLLVLRKSKIIEFLQVSYNFINKINQILPDDFKILYWMFDKEVDFTKEEVMPLTNHESRLSKTSYF